MSTEHSKKKHPVILMDADLIGFAAAIFIATAVMAVGFFRLQLPLFELAIRVGITFTVSYVAVFLLIKYLVWTALMELAQQRQLEQDQREHEHQEKAAQKQQEAAAPIAGQVGRN